MISIRKTIFPALALCAMLLNGFESSAADLSASVVRDANGLPNIKFAGSSTGEKIMAYDANGAPLAEVNWAASFIFPISEQALRDAKKKGGIDINALLRGMGLVSADADQLVRTELPIGITDLDGREIPAGTDVYLKLDRLAREGVIVPTNAWGGEMKKGGAAPAFNTTLLEKGVIGAKKKSELKPQVPKPGYARGVHGDGIVALDDSNNGSGSGEKFLSAPVCFMNGRATARFSSRWGGRKSQRTANGNHSSHIHQGTDLAVPRGTPVMAAAAGCIEYKDIGLNSNAGYGYNLKVDHGNKFVAQYAHMGNFSKKILEFVNTARGNNKKGQFCFARGEYLGNSGMTGNCTGPHLHFGLYKNGKSVPPEDHMISTSVSSISQTCDALQASNSELELRKHQTPVDEPSDAVVADRAGTSESSASGVTR